MNENNLFILFIHLLVSYFCVILGDDSRLSQFYDRIAKADAKYCPDRTRMLPDCIACIPGTIAAPQSKSCNTFISDTKNIRDEIFNLTLERFPQRSEDRKFGLYPYLEKQDFLTRHLIFGKLLSTKAVTHLIDIGAYYNPIHLFMAGDACPATIMVIEPILNPLSVSIPCFNNNNDNGKKSTHVLFMPITFKYYMAIKQMLPRPETVVCIGCDSHYGPNRKMLETAFPRPYTLFLEYPSDYVHNKPFKSMLGDGIGEKLIFAKKLQPQTNETQYTKRVMKIIQYQ